MAYVESNLPVWQVSATGINDENFVVQFNFLPAEETDRDAVASAIKAAIEAMTGITVTHATRQTEVSASF